MRRSYNRGTEARFEMIGTTLHHYRVLRRLGAGGMGEVYVAEDTKLGRSVALKLLPPAMAADPERLQRFQREARAVAALNHPNIVTIYTVEEANGVQFLTMELVEGKTLSALIRVGGLALGELRELAVPLVEAVAFAHQHGIVHRDLKPANIMLANDGRVKVLDFGLAKLKREPAAVGSMETTCLAPALTDQHTVVGTAWYMSPEQAEGRPVDHRSDIFSLGVVLYEMACGRRPFEGDTPFSVISAILKDTPTPLPDLRRDVPDAGVVGRVMDIYTIPAGGGEPVPATNDAATDWSPVWAPDGRYLYFVSERGGSMNLWRVAMDEGSGKSRGDPEPITTPAPFLAHPTVSADSRRIAYTAASQTSNIQRLALDPGTLSVKGEPTWVTTGSRMWVNPDPTPDGEWVVFYSRDQPEGDVYISRADGTGLRQLTSDAAIDRVPRWSPDANWVAFFSNRGGQLQVWKIRADGSDLQEVSETGGIPVWSPDGRRLATTRVLVAADQGAFVVDSGRPWRQQDHELLPLPDEPLRPFIPNAWSPDGRRLAGQIGFSDRGGIGVVLYTFASHSYERLTDFGEWPVWFGDSRQILFVYKGREFWLLDTQTKRTRKIYATVRDVLGPPRVTQDARVAYFSRRITEADIYLLTFE